MATSGSNTGLGQTVTPHRVIHFTIDPLLIFSGPIIHGINGFEQVFVLAASAYVGTEIVSLAAAESKNPQRDVPRVSNIPFQKFACVDK